MDQEQKEKYGDLVAKWREAVKAYGTGWDEDAPEIPVDYPISVEMANYTQGGDFYVWDHFDAAGASRFRFSNPECYIEATVRKVKAHMNRMISAMEFSYRDLASAGAITAPGVDAWQFVRVATEYLRSAHHGHRYETMLRSTVTTTLKGHATGIPSTLPWKIGVGMRLTGLEQFSDQAGDYGTWETRYLFELGTTVFTVCPFVLFETGGKQSHTQRSHILIRLETSEPVQFRPIMREITTRLVPVMSNMKIPDETIQVLKAYAGPTFTEDAAVRVQKILRGITAEFCEGSIFTCRIKVVSEDSHLAHNVVSTLENDLS